MAKVFVAFLSFLADGFSFLSLPQWTKIQNDIHKSFKRSENIFFVLIDIVSKLGCEKRNNSKEVIMYNEPKTRIK